MLLLNNFKKNFLFLAAILLFCIAVNNSYAQIKIVKDFPKKNIILKKVEQKKLIMTIKSVIDKFQKTRDDSYSFLSDEEKKKVDQNKSILQLAIEDASDYVKANGKITSSLLENIFGQTRDELSTMIDPMRMAKIIASLK